MAGVFYFCAMKDYIIVGAGLAGLCFAEHCHRAGRSFAVISDRSQNSSRVAGGLYNPVILKRLKLATYAAEHSDYIAPFYAAIEKRLDVSFFHSLPIYRKLFSVEEQNAWFEAIDRPGLPRFMLPEILHPKFKYLPAPFGFGALQRTGWMDTTAFLDAYSESLRAEGMFVEGSFAYDDLQVDNDHVNYQGMQARHIVFAEGFGIRQNPYFRHLPLEGTKGELLIIKAPNLQLEVAVNAGVFILPIGNDLYKVGATYEWEDKTSLPTDAGRKELTHKLEQLITCPYDVVEHLAGIRPTVKDRKPLVGTHSHHSNVHILNGLGTRGILLGPPMARELFNAIEEQREVDPFVNIKRFE